MPQHLHTITNKIPPEMDSKKCNHILYVGQGETGMVV